MAYSGNTVLIYLVPALGDGCGDINVLSPLITVGTHFYIPNIIWFRVGGPSVHKCQLVSIKQHECNIDLFDVWEMTTIRQTW